MLWSGCCDPWEVALPFRAWEPITGFAATVVFRLSVAFWQCANAATQGVASSLVIPDAWLNQPFDFWLWWAGDGTAAGNVRWNVELRRLRDGVVIPAAAAESVVSHIAISAVANQVERSSFRFSPTGWLEGDGVAVRLYREGAHALDTYAGAVFVAATMLRMV